MRLKEDGSVKDVIPETRTDDTEEGGEGGGLGRGWGEGGGRGGGGGGGGGGGRGGVGGVGGPSAPAQRPQGMKADRGQRGRRYTAEGVRTALAGTENERQAGAAVESREFFRTSRWPARASATRASNGGRSAEMIAAIARKMDEAAPRPRPAGGEKTRCQTNGCSRGAGCHAPGVKTQWHNGGGP